MPNLDENYHGHPRFKEIVEEIVQLHSEKNRQYATKETPLGNFYRTGNIIKKMLKPGILPELASCLSFMSKQVDGVYEIVGEGKQNTIESLHDKLRDITVYSILAMILIEEANVQTQNPR